MNLTPTAMVSPSCRCFGRQFLRTNCHYQNCEVLINELIKHHKQFSMLAYPNRTHAIKEGDNTKRHLYEMLTRYLTEHLPADRPPAAGQTTGQN